MIWISYCGQNISMIPGDIFLNQDNSLDAVIHIGGINFFNDQQKAIEEMIRVAKSGAHILIADETEKGAGAFCDDRGVCRSGELSQERIRKPGCQFVI